MRAPRKSPLVAVVAMAVLISACSSSGGGDKGKKNDPNANLAKGGTFTDLSANDPGALVPYDNIQTPGVSMFKFLYDYLVAIDPKGKIVPELAESWTVDGAKSTFKLKSGVTCSDGSPVKASTIAANFNYVKDPAHKSVIVGVILPSNKFTATADDATNTFTLTFDKPFGFLLQAVSLFPMVCGKGLTDPASLKGTSSGSGPFVLKKATPGVEYLLEKRTGYTWGPNGASTDAQGFPDRIVHKIVSSQTTMTNLLVSKAANTAVINGPNGARLGSAGFATQQDLQGSIIMLFNEAPGRPTSDIAVRKALIMALDIPQLSSVVTQGLFTKAGYSLTPSRSACDDSAAVSAIPKHDVAAAKKLLDDAGWAVGSDGIRSKNGKKLTLTAPYQTTTAGDAPASDLLAATWKDLGAKVTQVPLDEAAFSGTMFSTGNYDVLPFSEFAVPFQSILTGFLSGPSPPDGINTAHISTPGYTTNIQQAVATPGDAGCALWTKAAEALYTNADIIPISILPVRWYSRLATFDLSIGRIVPSSIRMHTK
jgi:peptide/nickel transport system substrate-binding protein